MMADSIKLNCRKGTTNTFKNGDRVSVHPGYFGSAFTDSVASEFDKIIGTVVCYRIYAQVKVCWDLDGEEEEESLCVSRGRPNT